MSTSDQQEATPQGSAGVPVAVSGRIPQLDGVRGLAIILVLIWHYFSMLVYPAESQFLFHFKQLFNLTWSGVDLFFVLSGFLIAGILVDQKGATNYFQVFYLRRTCRIMPLYFLIFFLYIGLARVPVFKGEAYKWVFADPLPL